MKRCGGFLCTVAVAMLSFACGSVSQQTQPQPGTPAGGPGLVGDEQIGYIVHQKPTAPNCSSHPVSVTYDPVHDKSTVNPQTVPVDLSKPPCHQIDWTLSTLPESDGRQGQVKFGYIFFINFEGDVAAHTNKRRHDCKKCPPWLYIVVPDQGGCSQRTCNMQVYTDLPDGNYYYGVQFFYYSPTEPHAPIRKETDPDLEVSGGSGFEDILKRLRALLNLLVG